MIAAGVASSMAQSSNIYSVNIVGYVNVPLAANVNTLLANPLDNGTNDLAGIGATLPNKTAVSAWTGSGFQTTTKSSTGWGTNLSIPAGRGFFVKSPTATTLTFIGQAASTNYRAMAANVNTLIGNMIPFTGNITDAGPGTVNLGGTLPNKSTVQMWTGSGYLTVTKTAGSWGTNQPVLNFDAAKGFFVKPAAAITWFQTVQ